MCKNQIIPGLMLCGIAALLLPAFRQAQDQNVILCAQYMRTDIASLSYYAADWDETYPTWTSDANLDSKLRSYQTSFNYMFACPATHQHFLFNSGLQGLRQESIPDFSSFEFVRDASPHPDGLISIGFADGPDIMPSAFLRNAKPHLMGPVSIGYADSHIFHGGVFIGDTTQVCIDNAKRLSRGVIMYSQDYDGVLPPMNSDQQVKSVMFPYIRNDSTFICPVTSQKYQFNSALGGTVLSQYPDTSSVMVLRDGVPHSADGISTEAFLDGHVFRPGWPHYPLPGDDNKLCIDNQRVGTGSVLLYAQDYDETLPDMTAANRTISLLSPYSKDYINFNYDWNFICPQTGLQYIFNASLSNQSLSTFANLDSYWVMADASPHPDGQKTTSFLSGAVQHPGYVNHANNGLQCVSSLREDIANIRMYALDYDEVLPPMHSSLEVDKAIAPYQLLKNDLICPELNLPYLPTSSLSGISIGAIPDTHNTILLQDPRPHPDGRITQGYLDGHVSKKYLMRSGVGGIRGKAR